MEDAIKEAPDKRKHTVVWDREDWELIERAAQKLGEDQHLVLDPVDIIRSGTLLRAREILTAA